MSVVKLAKLCLSASLSEVQHYARGIPALRDSNDRRLVFHDAIKGLLSAAKWIYVRYAITPTEVREWRTLTNVCGNRNIAAAEWLADEFRLTATDTEVVRSAFNHALFLSNLKTAKWVAARFEFTAEDVRFDDNFALRIVSGQGRVKQVQWMFDYFGLGLADARQGYQASTRLISILRPWYVERFGPEVERPMPRLIVSRDPRIAIPRKEEDSPKVICIVCIFRANKRATDWLEARAPPRPNNVRGEPLGASRPCAAGISLRPMRRRNVPKTPAHQEIPLKSLQEILAEIKIPPGKTLTLVSERTFRWSPDQRSYGLTVECCKPYTADFGGEMEWS